MAMPDSDPYKQMSSQERVLAEARVSLDLFEKGDHLFSKALDERDVNLRPRVIETYRQEAAALEIAIQNQATADEVDVIHNSYEAQRESLLASS